MKIKRIVLIILLIMWMFTVFGFSNQQGEESGSLSREVIKIAVNILPGLNQMSEADKAKIIDDIHPYVRKAAHFTIYFIGGIIIMLNACQYVEDDEKRVCISLIIGATYAISDEIHQMFVAGRAGEIRDVIIDSLGAATGVIIILIIQKIIRRKKEIK